MKIIFIFNFFINAVKYFKRIKNLISWEIFFILFYIW